MDRRAPAQLARRVTGGRSTGRRRDVGFRRRQAPGCDDRAHRSAPLEENRERQRRHPTPGCPRTTSRPSGPYAHRVRGGRAGSRRQRGIDHPRRTLLRACPTAASAGRSSPGGCSTTRRSVRRSSGTWRRTSGRSPSPASRPRRRRSRWPSTSPTRTGPVSTIRASTPSAWCSWCRSTGTAAHPVGARPRLAHARGDGARGHPRRDVERPRPPRPHGPGPRRPPRLTPATVANRAPDRTPSSSLRTVKRRRNMGSWASSGRRSHEPHRHGRRRAARARSSATTPARRWSSGCSTCCTRPPATACELVVFPELALTTFFPRWFVDDIARGRPLLRARDAGRRHAAAVRRGRGGSASASASATPSSTDADGAPLQHPDPRRARRLASSPRTARCTSPATSSTSPTGRSSTPSATTSSPGPTGFGVWRAFGGLVGMMICNDRRWPETLPGDGPAGRRADPVRLQHADPLRARPEPGHPAGVPQRARDAGRRLPERHVGGRRGQGRRRGGRRLARPDAASSPRRGQIVAQALTTGDELVVARCDLDWCGRYKGTLFDFDRYRRPEVYGRITSQRGVEAPS